MQPSGYSSSEEEEGDDKAKEDKKKETEEKKKKPKETKQVSEDLWLLHMTAAVVWRKSSLIFNVLRNLPPLWGGSMRRHGCRLHGSWRLSHADLPLSHRWETR